MKKILLDSYFIIRKSGIPKKEILIILISSLVTLFFEIVGIGIFIPLIDIIIKGSTSINLGFTLISIENIDTVSLYLIISVVILLTIGLKSFISLINAYLIANFWSSANLKISMNVFKNILNMDYNEFTKKSNSSYSNIIVLEIEKFSELISSLITYILEIFILISIFIILLFYDFYSSVFTFILLFISIIIIYLLFKKRLVYWGIYRQESQDKYQNDIKSGLLSYISIYTNGGLDYFLGNAANSLQKRNLFIGRQKIYASIPKNFIEFSGILIIISTGFFLYEFLNLSLEEIVSFLLILLISFTRILPSYNRILNSFNQLNFSKSIIDTIKDYLTYSNKKNEFGTEMEKFKKLISLKEVMYNYPNSNIKFGPFSLGINKGDIFGIFGKSGSGKSTLIKLIMGIVDPVDGEIEIDGFNYKEIKKSSFKNSFGYIEQNVRLFNASLFENITLTNNIKYDRDWYKDLLKICRLEEVDELNHTKLIQEDGINLSGGQIQRIGLARALYKKPKILVLDEFTSSLDKINKEKIIESILEFKNSQNLTIIMISHDLTLKDFCDDVLILK
ncbi:MAG: ABC transporter ATP-binding protein [Flavobacteriaceae bacterium]|nr:ABC transporter ATP-binding protein [Flavobacteriaceae bacterium]MBT6353350.1 ABC transporter ATP-binding protein [Pelagibacteraceae bacterium]